MLQLADKDKAIADIRSSKRFSSKRSKATYIRRHGVVVTSVGRINEVTLRRARLVLGWVTHTGSTPGGGTLFRYVTSHAGRLSLSSFRGRGEGLVRLIGAVVFLLAA